MGQEVFVNHRTKLRNERLTAGFRIIPQPFGVTGKYGLPVELQEVEMIIRRHQRDARDDEGIFFTLLQYIQDKHGQILKTPGKREPTKQDNAVPSTHVDNVIIPVERSEGILLTKAIKCQISSLNLRGSVDIVIGKNAAVIRAVLY
jgi:hypothetical protein